jgi:hypothetical protein
MITDKEDREEKEGFVFRSYNYLIEQSPTKQEEEADYLQKRLYRKAMAANR